MGPILYLFSICQAKVSLFHLFILFLHWTGIWPTRTRAALPKRERGLAHRQRVLRQQGPWSTFQVSRMPIQRDRATRSEVKCSSYTSWIIKVKNTDSSKELKFLFSAGPGYVIRFSLAIGAEDRMSPYLMYLLNRANRGITATFWSCLIPRVLKRGEEATAAECTTSTPLSSLLFVSRGSI